MADGLHARLIARDPAYAAYLTAMQELRTPIDEATLYDNITTTYAFLANYWATSMWPNVVERCGISEAHAVDLLACFAEIKAEAELPPNNQPPMHAACRAAIKSQENSAGIGGLAALALGPATVPAVPSQAERCPFTFISVEAASVSDAPKKYSLGNNFELVFSLEDSPATEIVRSDASSERAVFGKMSVPCPAGKEGLGLRVRLLQTGVHNAPDGATTTPNPRLPLKATGRC
jgi:hypothetical protein